MLVLRQKNTAIEVITENNKSKVVSELLKGVFMQEMDHLEKISERIYLLEGETTSIPDPLPQVGGTVNEF